MHRHAPSSDLKYTLNFVEAFLPSPASHVPARVEKPPHAGVTWVEAGCACAHARVICAWGVRHIPPRGVPAGVVALRECQTACRTRVRGLGILALSRKRIS